jgi:hypothetical protein
MTSPVTNNEWKAFDIGGERLIKYFDAIVAEQRKRWNAPDWRTQPIIEADLTNWNDIARALYQVCGPDRNYIASGQPGEAD